MQEALRLLFANLQGAIFSHRCKGPFFIRHVFKELFLEVPIYKVLILAGQTCKEQNSVRLILKELILEMRIWKVLLLVTHTCKPLILMGQIYMGVFA